MAKTSKRTTKKTPAKKAAAKGTAAKGTATKRAPAKTGATTARKAKAATLDEEQVRNRAYEIYRERGYAPGDPNEDWYRAETELRAKAGV